jgi:hypothetical protein
MVHVVLRLYTDAGELISKIKDHEAEVRELLTTVPGFRAYGLINTGAGAVSLTTCEDKAGTDESSTRAAAWVKANMPGSSISAPRIVEGERVYRVEARRADNPPHVLLRMFGPEALALLRDNEAKVRELMTKVSSFRAYTVIDTGTGGVSLTFADNKAGIDEVASHMVPWIQSKLPGVNPVETIEGDGVLRFVADGVPA